MINWIKTAAIAIVCGSAAAVSTYNAKKAVEEKKVKKLANEEKKEKESK